ncbi:MAG: class I SAM-dependent methyltransferase [Planctomycetota bacterium]|jgi:23S rRNA (cytosine1962-C5)-methyltransferase
MQRVTVGRASAGFLRRGPPWLRRDRFTRGLEQVRAGDAVALVDERGTPIAAAIADPNASICARVYHRRADKAFDPAAAIERAWQRRADLHADPATDCYRVVHGEADFLPGLRVERYADVLCVTAFTSGIAPHLDAICRTLHDHAPDCRIVTREHLADLRQRDIRTRMWDGSVLDRDAKSLGRELDVSMELTPFAGLATGIYVDQRATRTWLRQHCHGARVANLFAYTGLFSTSLLCAGAAHAVDVDLSAPALATAASNAARNGVGERHAIHHGHQVVGVGGRHRRIAHLVRTDGRARLLT